MGMICELEKLATEAEKFGSFADPEGYDEFKGACYPSAILKLISVVRAAQDVARERLKCPQYPENNTIPPKYMKALIVALVALEKPEPL